MKREKNNSLIIKIIKDEVGVYIPSDYKIKKWSKLAFQNIKKSIDSELLLLSRIQ